MKKMGIWKGIENAQNKEWWENGFSHWLFIILLGFPGGSEGKALPTMLETWVRSLGQEDPLEKAMAAHSSTLAWKILWTGDPGGLPSMGSHGVGRDWAPSLSLFTLMHWGRKWQPSPVFLPGESQERGSLVGCHLWGHTESDMTEVT